MRCSKFTFADKYGIINMLMTSSNLHRSKELENYSFQWNFPTDTGAYSPKHNHVICLFI